MNTKQQLVDTIIDLVIRCTAYRDKSGNVSITKADLLSTERKGENICKVRCILCRALEVFGYDTESIARILGRKIDTIQSMMLKGITYERNNFIYSLAVDEVLRECHKVMDEIKDEMAKGTNE